MRTPWTRALALFPIALVACGGGGATPDGAPGTPDAADPWFAGCEHVQADASAAAHGPSFTFGGSPTTLCGTLDPALGTPSATFDVGSLADADLLVRIATEEPLDPAAQVTVSIAHGSTSYGEWGKVLRDHGVFLGTLASGSNPIAIDVQGAPATAHRIHYRVTLAPIDTLSLCTVPFPPSHYSEALDGGDARGNDTVSCTDVLTPSPSDSPEETHLVVEAGGDAEIVGRSANVGDTGDGCADRDTFAVRTGALSEVMVRVGGPTDAELRSSLHSVDLAWWGWTGIRHPDIAVYPVLPDSTVWLSVSAVAGSPALPADYSVTVCGTSP